MKKILLASSSPYRKAQLEQLGLEFSWESPHFDEDQLKDCGLSPLELSRQLSARKGEALALKYPDHLIISGDQVCALGESIFDKPKSFEKACEQLTRLQGQTHELITSFSITENGQQETKTIIASMKMKSLSTHQIVKYLKHDEPYQCCGSYRLEALGISLFEAIDCPDHTAIIGLPLLSLSLELQKRGSSYL